VSGDAAGGGLRGTAKRRLMLTRSAYVSWLVSATGLAMVFASPNDDLLVSVGLGLAILGPLIALAAVVRQRTPEAVFVFLVALVAPVLLGIVFYLVARNAN
jgi:hypothetical protein